MNAIMVSVDYSDILAITLPLNRHHFGRVGIVTCSRDAPNVLPIAVANQADVIVTDLFYARKEDGVEFNKWAALEYGLDQFGREGWIALLDADIIWPKKLTIGEEVVGGIPVLTLDPPDSPVISPRPFQIKRGQICSPLRRMMTQLPRPFQPSDVPNEREWKQFHLHRNIAEWAGYTQIFHCDDPCLGEPPWHQIDWKHAGGADSFFQFKWEPKNKIRPIWEVLHLGMAGDNWMGRSSPLLDGTVLPEARERRRKLRAVWNRRDEIRRRIRRTEGKEAQPYARGPSTGEVYGEERLDGWKD